MAAFLKKVVRGFCVFWGVMFAVTAAAGVYICFTDFKPENVAAVVVCVAIAFLLLRKKKVKQEATTEPTQPVIRQTKASPYTPDAPEETLREMRKYYGAEQAQNDVRIMQESLQLIQQTTNFDTFLSRLGLLQRTALTLLQAEKAGCRGLPPGARGACEKALEASKSAKVNFLYNTYIKETNEALRLKTSAGKRKRLEAYLSKLREHEADFMDVEEAYKKAIYDTETLL